MKNINKTLKLAGIMALIVNILNISNLFLNIFVEFSVFGIVEEGICIVLSFLTGITYLCLMKKNNKYLIEHKGLFLALSLINLFNNIFVWLISLWVEFAISSLVRAEYMKKMFNNNKDNQNSDNIVDLNDNDYEIKKETENLSDSLKELESLKSKNLISEEEYEELRTNLINKFLSKY